MSSTRQPAGVLTMVTVSTQSTGFSCGRGFLSANCSFTLQCAILPAAVHVLTLKAEIPSKLGENRSPSTNGGESLLALAKRASAASASVSSFAKSGEIYGAYLARCFASGTPSCELC